MNLCHAKINDIKFTQKLKIAKAILGSRVGVTYSETVEVELWNGDGTTLVKRYYFVTSEKTSLRHLLNKVEAIISNTKPWFKTYQVHVGPQKKCVQVRCYDPERPLKVVHSIPDIRYTDI